MTLARRRLLALAVAPLLFPGKHLYAQVVATPSHTWGFVTAKFDSRFSDNIYTAYGYDSFFLIAALVENPRTDYSERIVGIGARLPMYRRLSQVVATAFSNASDSRYLQIYYTPAAKLGGVSASASFKTYLPLDSAGVGKFEMTSLLTARVYGPVAAGVVYELDAAEHVATGHGSGGAVRIDLPHAEAGIDALLGIAHHHGHARLLFRAFY